MHITATEHVTVVVEGISLKTAWREPGSRFRYATVVWKLLRMRSFVECDLGFISYPPLGCRIQCRKVSPAPFCARINPTDRQTFSLLHGVLYRILHFARGLAGDYSQSSFLYIFQQEARDQNQIVMLNGVPAIFQCRFQSISKDLPRLDVLMIHALTKLPFMH